MNLDLSPNLARTIPAHLRSRRPGAGQRQLHSVLHWHPRASRHILRV